LSRGEQDARRGQKLLKQRIASAYRREQNGQSCFCREAIIGSLATSARRFAIQIP
jgi:hypothetical protein